MNALFFLLLVCVGATAQAQIYSAPGMALSPQRSSLAQEARAAASLQRAASLQKVRAAAAKNLFVAARYWTLKDSAYLKAATSFYQHIRSQFRWPGTTISNGVEGKLTIRLKILPNGSVEVADIVNRQLTQSSDYPGGSLEKGSEALDGTVLDFAKKLHFQPAANVDTMRFSITFRLQ